jgi:anti-sigma B factor antagonist
MRIDKTMLYGVPVLQVVGDIDHHGAEKFLYAAEVALISSGTRILLVLEACPYLDSGGIGVLISLLRRVKARSGWMGIVAPSENVHRLLEIVALTRDPDFMVFANQMRAEERLRDEPADG